MTGSIEGLPRIVHLNVGGAKFQTSRETLLKWRNEKLDAMFAGENDAVLQDDDGSWFIDRDGDRFRHVLAFMRAGMLLTEDYEPRELRRIAVDADFFGLDELKQVCDRALGDTTVRTRRNELGKTTLPGGYDGRGAQEQSYSNPGSPREVARPNSGLDMPSSPALATNSQPGKPDSGLMAPALRAGHNYGGRGIRATDSMLASGKPNIFIFQRAAKRGDENLTVVDGQTLHIIRQLSIPTDTPFFGECGVMGSGDKRCVLVYFSTMSDENKVVLVDWANSTVLRSASWPCARLCADPLDDTHFGLGLVVDEGEDTYVKVQALNCSTFLPKSQREFKPSHPVRRQRNSSTMVPRLWNTPRGRVLVCVYLEGGRLEAWVWDWQEDEVVQHLLLEETASSAPTAVASFVPLITHKTFLICSQEKNKGMWFWDYKTNGLASYTRRQTGTKWVALGDSHIAFFDMGLDSAVAVVDMLTGEVVREFPHRDGHKMIDCCALGERHLVLLSEVESAGNSIRVVDFRTGEVAQSIQNPELHYQGLDRVQAVDDKLFLVLPRTTHGCRARVFDAATGTEVSRWDSLDAPWGTLTPIQGTSMAVGSFLQHRKVKDSKPRVVILDYKKGTELQSFESEVQVAFKALQEGRIVK